MHGCGELKTLFHLKAGILSGAVHLVVAVDCSKCSCGKFSGKGTYELVTPPILTVHCNFVMLPVYVINHSHTSSPSCAAQEQE